VTSPDKLPGISPKVHWILVISAGLWGVLYLVVVSLWPGQPNRPDTVMERKHVSQVASSVIQPRVGTRTRAKVKTKRKGRSRALAAHIFNASRSLN
jgi:hypothetical protein